MITFFGRLGFVVVVLLALVGILSVVSRFVFTVEFLADPASIKVGANEPPGAVGFQGRYYAHPYLTLVHVVSGFLFMTIGPLQFVAAIRNRWLGVHRWCGRVFLLASLVGVVSAVVLVPVLPVFGSFSTTIGVLFFSALFMVSLAQGYRHIRRREIAEHREWMIRLFAIGLGISTIRVLTPFLMVPPLGASFVEAWDTMIWLGFSINILVAEVWINLTRRRPEAGGPAPAVKINPAVRRPARTAQSGLAN